MKKILSFTLLVLLTISYAQSQNQNYTTGTNIYTFNSIGTFQLTGLPVGSNIQVECYAGGGGGGGVWTSIYASTSTGGAGGGGYAKLNTFPSTGGSIEIIVGKGGLQGSGSIALQEAYDGQDGDLSAVYVSSISDTICKATGGKRSFHASAVNGTLFSPKKASSAFGNGGQGTIGDILQNGSNGTLGTTPSFFTGVGGDGGNGAGPLGGAGGLFANSAVANYGVDGSPYGGGGTGCADYEGNASTFKIGGSGASGGVIITILSITTEGITTQSPAVATFCAGDNITVPFTIFGTFNPANAFNLQLSDASGSFASPVVIGTINTTVSGNISGIIPVGTITGNGYRVRVDATNPAIIGIANVTDLTINSKPTSPTAAAQDFCGTETVASLIPTGIDISWYSTSGSITPLANSELLVTQEYFVSQITDGCESDKVTVKVTVAPIPTINAGVDQAICDGGSVILTATNPDGATISWNNGITDGVSFIPVIDSITYIITATKDGCTNSDSVLVSILENPLAIAPDTILSICQNETSIILNGSIGGAATTGQWIGGAGTWNNATDPQNATYTASMSDVIGWIELKLIAYGGSCTADTATTYIEIKDCTSGISQNEMQSTLKCYPNPAYSSFEISDDQLTTNYSHYVLVSMTGNVVQTGEIDSNHQKIDVLTLKKGFYLLQLTGKKSAVLKLEVR